METTNNPETLAYAGFGRRLLATMVDGAILTAIGLIIQTALGHNPYQTLNSATSVSELENLRSSLASTFTNFINIVIGLAYYLIFYVHYDGATPGKKLLGIKVIRENQTPMTYAVAFIRQLGTYVSGMILGIGYLMVIFDSRKQALHDKIASTFVVKTEARPRIGLAIFIVIIASIFNSVTMAIAFFKGFQLARDEIKQEQGVVRPTPFMKNLPTMPPAAMKPEAKVHYQKAMDLFTQIKAANNNAKTITPLANQTIAELKQAAVLDPSYPDIFFALGNAYTWPNTSGKLADGLVAFQKAESLSPSSVKYINGVAGMQLRLGLYDNVVLETQKALRLDNQSALAYLYSGYAYMHLKVTDQAKTNLQKAVDLMTQDNQDGYYDQYILDAQKSLGGLK